MMAIGEGPVLGDAFGRALSDMQAGRPGVIVVERDDGLVEADFGDYLSGWSDGDTWALQRAPGRVLDLGAGALDVSQGAIEVCRRRGVQQVFLGSVAELAATGPAPFDSVLMLG